MGFSYRLNHVTGRRVLACDGCPTGHARKRPCPAGWCPSSAYCAACWAAKKGAVAASHAGCKAASDAYAAKEAARAALVAAGAFVRCSARTAPDGSVHVLFRGASGMAGATMARRTYDTVPLDKPATRADFEVHGPTWDAPAEFAW